MNSSRANTFFLLCTLYTLPFSASSLFPTTCHLCHVHGMRPSDHRKLVHRIYLHPCQEEEIWRWNKTGTFTINSAYKQFIDGDVDHSMQKDNLTTRCPLKIRIFLWLLRMSFWPEISFREGVGLGQMYVSYARTLRRLCLTYSCIVTTFRWSGISMHI